MDIGPIWNLVALGPVVNVLIMLTHYLFSSFGLAIIALTIIVNLALYPLTRQQLRSTQAMQALQPKLAELQKKYARDRQRLGQEQMKLYRESGMSPAGCLVPMVVQMPVWIALYQAIIRVLAVSPEDFLGLSPFLYSWPVLYSVLPLGNRFLGLDLATGNNFFLAILVGGSMWVQQKMTTPPTTDPRQAAQARMMLWMMPLMFGFFTLSFPSGLALFWVTSTVIRILLQYFTSGWGTLLPARAVQVQARDQKYKKRLQESSSKADIESPDKRKG
ncbi:MAG: YidC/Oxa1 family membrane protein insertase [Chloroflexota bacterium]|nr:YidC/Oxa1 family membrane protein insertase [Chloroflexota bacterium]